MKVVTRKVIFEFSEEERKALETIKKIIADLSNYCDKNDTTILFNTADYESTYRDLLNEIAIIDDLLTGNYDAD